MSSTILPDDYSKAMPKKHRKLKLNPISRDVTAATTYTTWQANTDELQALSAKVDELASGITEEHVQSQKESFSLELPYLR